MPDWTSKYDHQNLQKRITGTLRLATVAAAKGLKYRHLQRLQSLQRREALHESYDVSANLKQAAHSQIEYPILKSCLETLFFWPKNYGEKNTCTNWNLTVIPLSDLKWHKCLRIMENKSLPSLTNYVKDGTRNILGGISSTWACSNSAFDRATGRGNRKEYSPAALEN